MRSVCVFCGSNSGRGERYGAGARALGAELAARGIKLVYGGGRVGLMGEVADAALAAGGHVTGVIPAALVAREVGHNALSEQHVVDSMHERKALMAELSEGFVAMPGGFGTLDETFEILTWAQLGMHRHPVGLLNVDGYFDKLLAFVDHAIGEGFVRPEYKAMLSVASTPAELLETMARYRPPTVTKWITKSET